MDLRLVTNGRRFELQQYNVVAGEWSEIPVIHVSDGAEFVNRPDSPGSEQQFQDVYPQSFEGEHPIDAEFEKQAMFRAIHRLADPARQNLRFSDIALGVPKSEF